LAFKQKEGGKTNFKLGPLELEGSSWKIQNFFASMIEKRGEGEIKSK